MKITLATFGPDLLKILSVGLVAAEAAAPIVDLTQPGVAQVYNLSVQQGLTLVEAFLMHSAAPPAPPAPAAAASVDSATPEAPVPAVRSAVQETADAPVVHGPGLSAVVPA